MAEKQAKDKFKQGNSKTAKFIRMGQEPGTKYGQNPQSKAKGK